MDEPVIIRKESIHDINGKKWASGAKKEVAFYRIMDPH
jgi:hypothetical protein